MSWHSAPATPKIRPFLGSLGPLSDLESHLPEDWWQDIFNALYLLTDGDVVENDANTREEVDLLIAATGAQQESRILDLCCGQGRHVLELARRGYTRLTGIDRSRYLIRLARKRARSQGLAAQFREGDARQIRLGEASQDIVAVMGNSFGYFASRDDDSQVLRSAARVLGPDRHIILDIADGDWMRGHFLPRSWEWIDKHHFVCRERELSSDGDRLVCREVVVHDERGVIADQFYAERLYSRSGISTLLAETGFRDIRFHSPINARSERDQDLGMMAHRMVLTARPPAKVAGPKRRRRDLDVAVLLGDPRRPDRVKPAGAFGEEDHETVRRLKDALYALNGYRFRFLDDHAAMIRTLAESRPDIVLNLCDEGWENDPFRELHVPAYLEMLHIPYSGAGPSCLGMCYDKALVRSLAMALEIPVPMETFIQAGDRSATMPSTFPALLKPNFGDSSFGITKDAVVQNSADLIDYLENMRRLVGDRPLLVQEFLPGKEYSVCLIGNPGAALTALPVLEADFSALPPDLPPILGYESKWDPASPYWTQLAYRQAELKQTEHNSLVDHAIRLFDRLGCRDYARFDFRCDGEGVAKLLEVNPNPGWCWDGKMNLMAGIAGMTYPELLSAILEAALERAERAAGTGFPAELCAANCRDDGSRNSL